MPADVAGQLTAAHRVRDQGDVPQVEVGEQVVQVVGEGVEVVAVVDGGGAAVASAVVCDTAKACVGDGLQLVLPGIAVQGPAVDEDDRASAPPVLVEDLHTVTGLANRHE